MKRLLELQGAIGAPRQLQKYGNQKPEEVMMKKKQPPEGMMKKPPAKCVLGPKKKARATLPPEEMMMKKKVKLSPELMMMQKEVKKKAQATLIDLRRQKKQIEWEKFQLCVEASRIQEAIEEEEFRLRMIDTSDEEEGVEEDWVEDEDDVSGQVGVEEDGVEAEDAEEEEDVAGITGFEDVEEAEEDVDEDLEAGASDVNEGLKKSEEEWYARKWLEQNGDARGIPKKYTPCSYFFKARHGCQKKETCDFSHDEEIFCREPFAALLTSLSWERKEGKDRRGRKNPPVCVPPPKKRPEVKEEDL